MSMSEEEFDVDIWLADFLAVLEGWRLERADIHCDVFQWGE